jgi:hypothetical protein
MLITREEPEMIKLFIFLKRKEGITREQFKNHFDNVHAKIADKYFTFKMVEYTRNYISSVSTGTRAGREPMDFPFDCISEWTLPDQKTMDEIFGLLTSDEIGQEFYRDEENFLDRSRSMMIRCDDGDIVPHLLPSPPPAREG